MVRHRFPVLVGSIPTPKFFDERLKKFRGWAADAIITALKRRDLNVKEKRFCRLFFSL